MFDTAFLKRPMYGRAGAELLRSQDVAPSLGDSACKVRQTPLCEKSEARAEFIYAAYKRRKDDGDWGEAKQHDHDIGVRHRATSSNSYLRQSHRVLVWRRAVLPPCGASSVPLALMARDKVAQSLLNSDGVRGAYAAPP